MFIPAIFEVQDARHFHIQIRLYQKFDGVTVLDSPFVNVRFVVFPLYLTFAEVPEVLLITACVNTLLLQAISSVNPPRALKPVTFPSLHAPGMAGKR